MGASTKVTWLLAAVATFLLQAPDAMAAASPDGTTSDFVSSCDSASPPETCLNALMHVEQIVDSGERPNDTCDGGPDVLLKAHSNAELDIMLTERVIAVVGWLKKHPEYSSRSYGDGVWAALKGVYCR